MLILFN